MSESIRDVKSPSTFIDEFPLKRCILIMDRGVFPKSNVYSLLSLGASFIQPLRQNSKPIGYKIKPNKAFIYKNRGIKSTVKEFDEGNGKLKLLFYEDVA